MIINQPNMVIQEDLASLFAKNMTLGANQPAAPPPQDDRIVYISQHYTHSAHVVPQPQQQQQHQQPPPPSPQDEPMVVQRPSSEPPRSDLEDLELLLRSHGVNTPALSPPQVELFRSAGDAQKMRLIQLWTICPPNDSTDNPTLTWSNTTVEQEEMLAQRRFELQQQQQQQEQGVPVTEVVMSLDGTETETTLGSSPAASMQSANGQWAAPSHHHMEPYMQSGYEELARREYDASARKAAEYKTSTDPVYEATGGMLDWERQQWMENQYGSIMAWREDEEML